MQLTNSSGAVVKTYTYEAFGSLVAQTGTVANPYQFQTKHYSPATGLANFGFRSYNPAVGRFITADPLGFVNGPNLYAYVGNNPVNWIDPWGLKMTEQQLWDEVNELEESPALTPEQQQRLEELYEEISNRETIQPYPWWRDPIVITIIGTTIGGKILQIEINIFSKGNIFKIISKTLKRGFRIDPAHHGQPWGHPKFWGW